VVVASPVSLRSERRRGIAYALAIPSAVKPASVATPIALIIAVAVMDPRPDLAVRRGRTNAVLVFAVRPTR